MLLVQVILDLSDSIFRTGICCTKTKQKSYKTSFSQMMLKNDENLHFM